MMKSIDLAKSNKSNRDSSIEAFRIVVTLYVLIVHFNGYFIGLDSKLMNFYSSSQILIESFTVVAVNGFILISGYFGIKKVIKSIWKLYTCLISISVPLAIGRCFFNHTFILNDIIISFFPISLSDNYFINGYIIMILFSPLINNFTTNKSFIYLIILLTVIEFWYDCICKLGTFGFVEGYSGQHFILIYAIGKAIACKRSYIYKYKSHLFILGYCFCCLITSLMCYYKISWALYYSNPIIILSSCFLFLFFATPNNSFNNNFINRIARCSLFVYILQISSPFETYLIRLDQYLFYNYSYINYLLLCFIVIFSFYLFCFIWNEIRIVCTSKIINAIEIKLDKILNII